jgi:hypothetical protein
MARCRITERNDTFNQLSSSSSSTDTFQVSEHIAKLESIALLMAQAEALSAVSMRDGFRGSSQSEQYHYSMTLNELIVTSREQLDDELSISRQNKLKK